MERGDDEGTGKGKASGKFADTKGRVTLQVDK